MFQFITVVKTISIPELPLSLFLLLRNYVKDDQNMMFKVLYCASRNTNMDLAKLYREPYVMKPHV